MFSVDLCSFMVCIYIKTGRSVPLCFSISAMHLENIHSGGATGRVNPQKNTERGQRSPNTRAHLTPVVLGTVSWIHLKEDRSHTDRHRTTELKHTIITHLNSIFFICKYM